MAGFAVRELGGVGLRVLWMRGASSFTLMCIPLDCSFSRKAALHWAALYDIKIDSAYCLAHAIKPEAPLRTVDNLEDHV